jgi:hypothetical protein
MTFLKNHLNPLFLTAILTICAIYLCSGCSGKSNPTNPDGNNIVCKDGEAWITDDDKEGYIFRENGDMIAVASQDDAGWFGYKVGTYSTDGGKLTMVLTGSGAYTISYSISGGKLTLVDGSNKVYAKRTGVYVDL